MTLNIKALAMAASALTGLTFFLVGVAYMIFPTYGGAFLGIGASIYPGYDGPDGFGSVIVVTLYALVDGAIAGALFGWFYNLAVKGVGQRAT